MEAILILLGIHIIAVISPGPDFFLVIKASLTGHFKHSLMCCFGIASGVATHFVFVYFGLSVIISNSPITYSGIVILGAVWLLKLGVSALFAKTEKWQEVEALSFANNLTAFRDGYLTNLFNPKAFMYFVSVISPFLKAGKLEGAFFIMASIITLSTFAWFVLVATILNHRRIKSIFQNYQSFIDKIFAVIIFFFACSILYLELTSIFCNSANSS